MELVHVEVNNRFRLFEPKVSEWHNAHQPYLMHVQLLDLNDLLFSTMKCRVYSVHPNAFWFIQAFGRNG